jgi:hypothetical protein
MGENRIAYPETQFFASADPDAQFNLGLATGAASLSSRSFPPHYLQHSHPDAPDYFLDGQRMPRAYGSSGLLTRELHREPEEERREHNQQLLEPRTEIEEEEKESSQQSIQELPPNEFGHLRERLPGERCLASTRGGGRIVRNFENPE